MTIELTEGNISTIAAWLYDIIGPTYLAAYGIDQGVFTVLMVIIVGVIINVWSSYNPNTFKFLGNNPTTKTEDVVGEEDGC